MEFTHQVLLCVAVYKIVIDNFGNEGIATLIIPWVHHPSLVFRVPIAYQCKFRELFVWFYTLSGFCELNKAISDSELLPRPLRRLRSFILHISNLEMCVWLFKLRIQLSDTDQESLNLVRSEFWIVPCITVSGVLFLLYNWQLMPSRFLLRWHNWVHLMHFHKISTQLNDLFRVHICK